MKSLDILCQWFGKSHNELSAFKLVHDGGISVSLHIGDNLPVPLGAYPTWEGVLTKVFEHIRSWEIDHGLYPDLKGKPTGQFYRGIAKRYLAEAQAKGFTSFLVLGNQSKYPTDPETEQFTKNLLKRIEETTGREPGRHKSEIEFEKIINEEDQNVEDFKSGECETLD